MNNYEAKALLKIQRTYDFIAMNPGCTLLQIADHLAQPVESVRTYLRQLRDGEYLVATAGVHVHRGQQPTTYTISDKGRPTVPPPSRRKSDRAVAAVDKIDLPCQRPRGVAMQVGMPPYGDLPREFFRCGQVAA